MEDSDTPSSEAPSSEAPSGATRSQNVVYTLPSEWSTIAQFLSSAVERVDPAQSATQVLVLTGDDEASVAITSAVARLSHGRGVTALPVTGARRAQRFLKDGPAHVVAGTPAALAELVGAAALKLDTVRTVVVAWADDLLGGADAEVAAVETVLAEVPKEAARIVVTSEASPAVESFVERYLRRPRRVGARAAGSAAVDMDVLTVAASARPDALRRLLDELDPASAAVIVRDPDAEAQVRRILAALGYAADGGPVRVSQGEVEAGTELAVLYDLPLSPDALAETTAGRPKRVLALASPRQLGHLRALAGGGRVAPLTLPDAARQARRREDRLREELRTELAAGLPSRELLAIEPLLEEFDAAEVAAAALRLLDRARAGARAEVQQAAMSFTSGAAPGWVRVFMTVGERDGAQRGDLVGAIANESGVTSDQIGKIDLRDTHAIVQVAAPVADKVIEAMNGVQIKGRRVAARLERERVMGGPERSERGDRPPRREREERGDRPVRRDREDRGDRPSRPTRAGGFDRGDRADRGDRPRGPRAPRAGGFDRGDRPERGARPARPPRAGGGRFERGDRGDRPARPRSDRGEGGYDRGDYAARQRRDAERPPRDDFAERAERLQRAKRVPGRRTRTDEE